MGLRLTRSRPTRSVSCRGLRARRSRILVCRIPSFRQSLPMCTHGCLRVGEFVLARPARVAQLVSLSRPLISSVSIGADRINSCCSVRACLCVVVQRAWIGMMRTTGSPVAGESGWAIWMDRSPDRDFVWFAARYSTTMCVQMETFLNARLAPTRPRDYCKSVCIHCTQCYRADSCTRPSVDCQMACIQRK